MTEESPSPASTEASPAQAPTPLAFSVVRGDPGADELAALAVVLAAATAGGDDGGHGGHGGHGDEASPRSLWSHPRRRMARGPGLGWAH